MAKTIVPPGRQSSPPPAPRAAESQSAVDPLTIAHRQAALALDRARQSEQRARVAEMRALWAERQARPRNAEDKRRQQRQDRRNNVLYGVLWLGLVSLVIGGYVSLLGPVRQRLASQAAQIQELTRQRDQLQYANQQLVAQVETLTAPPQR